MDRSPVKGFRGQTETEDAWPISKTDSQPILKVASLQCEAKENIMLFLASQEYDEQIPCSATNLRASNVEEVNKNLKIYDFNDKLDKNQ